MFERSAAFYDAVYARKDYRGEVARLRALIEQHKASPGRTLLDVACGTGRHLNELAQDFKVVGVDLDPKMVALARERVPAAEVYCGDMESFDLRTHFDVVTCLFSSIGYVRTTDALVRTIANLARHTAPGGLVIVEPWFAPDGFFAGQLHGLFVEEPELMVARMNVSAVRDNISLIDFHYLVGTPSGIEHVTEHHELGLFTEDQHLTAFRRAGLATHHDRVGLSGRGLYVGLQPL